MWRNPFRREPSRDELVRVIIDIHEELGLITAQLKEIEVMDTNEQAALDQLDADLKQSTSELGTLVTDQGTAITDLEAAVKAAIANGANVADIAAVASRLQASHTAFQAVHDGLKSLDASAVAADATTKSPTP